MNVSRGTEGATEMAPRVFGQILTVPVGTTFPSRKMLSQSRVHRPTMAGIAGSGVEGAESIVASGGYEDDLDEGDVLTYTGQGGTIRAQANRWPIRR